MGGRVLIVDDEPGMRFLVRMVLEAQTDELHEASSAAEARERLRAEPWAVAVLDNRMPDGTGLEVAREAREAGVTTPILIYSGYLDEASRGEAAALGLPAIDKSRPEELAEQVRELLGACSGPILAEHD